MSEAPAENGPAQDQTQGATETDQPEKSETDWQAEARKWEKRSKENAQAKAELAELRKQQRSAMTEAERAVAEAEERGRTAATTEFGKELAQTQFDALAGRRNPDFDTAKALKRLDLASLLGQDGRPDLKEIQAAVDDLVPAPPGTPTYDGGAREKSAKRGDMNSVIRKAAGYAN